MTRSRFLTVAILLTAIAGCGGGGDDSAKRSPAGKATPEAAARPADAAARIYGPIRPLGYVRQEFYDRSLTGAEFKRETDTITHSVRTACDSNRRDARRTSVHIEVDQFRSEKAARSGTSASSPSSRARTSATWAASPSRASTTCCTSGVARTSSASGATR